MRFAPGQVPEECCRLVFEHLRARVQKGAELSIEEVNTGTPGFRLPTESPLFALAKDLLAKLDPRGPVFVWEGASIPVVSELARVSGAAPLLVGFGRDEDRIHAPNESYSLAQFARARAWSRLFFG
jgi:acetylornithine deacetylase/succinyl-diaminopimelate desuccinylase-like protein